MTFTRPVTPSLTVDIIIELAQAPGRILLIERKYPPFGWALPGGFVDVGESVERAAVREAKEETSLDVSLIRLLGCYSAPERDKRGHTVSVVFIATADGEPEAADDAKFLKLWEVEDLPELAFDHQNIVDDYLMYKKTSKIPNFQSF
ncbi:MAG: NUDIX hydrolase [Gammaproteobacteria bacterium]|nr:NUDIX hydrolase [Gammaproteobacteria bacterium]